jgi:hypothetical protein
VGAADALGGAEAELLVGGGLLQAIPSKAQERTVGMRRS